MAATTLFSQPFLFLVDADGIPLVGAEVTIYAAGTVTPQPVYHDSALSNAWLQPIVTNSAGQSDGPVYVTPTPALKVVAVTSTGAAISGFPLDNWSPAAVAT